MAASGAEWSCPNQESLFGFWPAQFSGISSICHVTSLSNCTNSRASDLSRALRIPAVTSSPARTHLPVRSRPEVDDEACFTRRRKGRTCTPSPCLSFPAFPKTRALEYFLDVGSVWTCSRCLLLVHVDLPVEQWHEPARKLS